MPIVVVDCTEVLNHTLELQVIPRHLARSWTSLKYRIDLFPRMIIPLEYRTRQSISLEWERIGEQTAYNSH